MPSKEIKELRQTGRLDEAYVMALSELQNEPDNIWSKRNMSWVLYSQLESKVNDFEYLTNKIEEVKALQMPESENLFFENIAIPISKAARHICHSNPIDIDKLNTLFHQIKDIPFKKDSKWYSVLYSAFHKGMKESSRFLEFADWWDFNNFKEEDYRKETLPNGREVMALAEQAYIAYAKHLLPKPNMHGEVIYDPSKIETFLPLLDRIIEKHPDFQYPAYFKAKLLLVKGGKNEALSSLLPFVKKKRNDFWAWEILGEAFKNDPEKLFACYCRALLCRSPEEMLVGLRQKMASILIKKGLFPEAKTEVVLLIKARSAKEFKIPFEVTQWQSQEWYTKATERPSNIDFYKRYSANAEALLFNDVPEESIIVEFVNTDKKILNFIASESKFGFLKYDRFLKEVRIGDILKARFQPGSNEGSFKLFTLVKSEDENLRNQFIKEVEGNIRIGEGKKFGFVNDVFISPNLVDKYKLANNDLVKGKVMKTYNKDKKQWVWKMITIYLS